MSQITVVRVMRSGVSPGRSIVVWVLVNGETDVRQFGYHESQFDGMTRAQIRQFILSNIRDILTATVTNTDPFDPGEVINLP